MAVYDPADNAELSDDEGDRHCDADSEALNAYFVHPASNLSDLALKLRTFRDEDAHELTRVREIVAVLARDASELAFDEACRWAKWRLEAA